jgi:hypothetical protein
LPIDLGDVLWPSRQFRQLGEVDRGWFFQRASYFRATGFSLPQLNSYSTTELPPETERPFRLKADIFRLLAIPNTGILSPIGDQYQYWSW